MKPGTYTVTGKVPGTAFEPKATVIVKVPVGTFTPPSRLVEAFPLSQVVLERDTKGRETPFIRNRDKFIRGLAAAIPTASSTTSGTRSDSRSPRARSSSKDGTTRRRGCAATRAVIT